MNSTLAPKTPTNILESVGSVPETLAVTNIPKTKNFKKCTEIPVSGKLYLAKSSKTGNPKNVTAANFSFGR